MNYYEYHNSATLGRCYTLINVAMEIRVFVNYALKQNKKAIISEVKQMFMFVPDILLYNHASHFIFRVKLLIECAAPVIHYLQTLILFC